MKKGFTLFEVMIALAVMGSAVTVILTLVSALFTTSTKSAHAAVHITAMKNMLYEVHENPLMRHTQEKNLVPAVTLTYKEKPLSGKSVFKGIKNLVIEQVTAQWYDKGVQRTDSIVFFLYKPEKRTPEAKEKEQK